LSYTGILQLDPAGPKHMPCGNIEADPVVTRQMPNRKSRAFSTQKFASILPWEFSRLIRHEIHCNFVTTTKLSVAIGTVTVIQSRLRFQLSNSRRSICRWKPCDHLHGRPTGMQIQTLSIPLVRLSKPSKFHSFHFPGQVQQKVSLLLLLNCRFIYVLVIVPMTVRHFDSPKRVPWVVGEAQTNRPLT
jgi:hypothetical protein